MRTVSKPKGYLTVYLSLVFAIVLSLLLTLIEGAAVGATRLQAELAAYLGLDSVFAEYHRELMKQYGVFYIPIRIWRLNRLLLQQMDTDRFGRHRRLSA